MRLSRWVECSRRHRAYSRQQHHMTQRECAIGTDSKPGVVDATTQRRRNSYAVARSYRRNDERAPPLGRVSRRRPAVHSECNERMTYQFDAMVVDRSDMAACTRGILAILADIGRHSRANGCYTQGIGRILRALELYSGRLPPRLPPRSGSWARLRAAGPPRGPIFPVPRGSCPPSRPMAAQDRADMPKSHWEMLF